MAKKKKKRNPQDTTLRNTRAAKRTTANLALALAALDERTLNSVDQLRVLRDRSDRHQAQVLDHAQTIIEHGDHLEQVTRLLNASVEQIAALTQRVENLEALAAQKVEGH